MAMHSVQPGFAPANPIVAAYLAARATNHQVDRAEATEDSAEARMAQFAEAGAKEHSMAWCIHSAEHAALVAILAADRLQNLVQSYSLENDRRQRVVTFGVEEQYEVYQVTHALLNLWKFLDPAPSSPLRALAQDMRLIDSNGHQLD